MTEEIGVTAVVVATTGVEVSTQVAAIGVTGVVAATTGVEVSTQVAAIGVKV
jgi:hypothetical protein